MTALISHLSFAKELYERYIYIYIYFFFFCFFRVAPMAYGGSQARGIMGATAASLCQSHSNTGPELHLQPTPQLTAMPDPWPRSVG